MLMPLSTLSTAEHIACSAVVTSQRGKVFVAQRFADVAAPDCLDRCARGRHGLQIVEKDRDLLQIQVLWITQSPGLEVASKPGISAQAVFEYFVALRRVRRATTAVG